ncbi:adenosylcobinamide-phosphate synthase CbiB [Meiothermus sp.]|uniref:adenosylcobinamide-phosphate synthase CbiB n=1 Tax=Meiothermus sp. TaxID=1955249 RepID=UPI0021DE5736|nr:adenosylcobinamide-phosphate synthase CbiB [Meiothermus sp.]GIW32775.1 MAG: cobalamin biosynthesis protein CobD [Meiothermus sp.]
MTVLLALWIDWVWGEPKGAFHPVVWMGRYLAWVGKGLTQLPPLQAFWGGAGFWCMGAGFFAGIYWILSGLLSFLPQGLELLLTALFLKPLFAFRMLLDEAHAVEMALGEGLEAGRSRLQYLVSRDTSSLSASEVRESLLESAAENLSDSVIAPLFWFLLLGLPGAALYRFANTADAMWGYRGEWEWAGRWAARIDDVLNWLPARLTAGLVWLIGGWCWRAGTSRILRFSFATLRREAHKTPSPNAGWPMAALALALGLRLGKPRVYTLNRQGRPPAAEDVTWGLALVQRAGWVGGVLLAAIEACQQILDTF